MSVHHQIRPRIADFKCPRCHRCHRVTVGQPVLCQGWWIAPLIDTAT